VGEGASVAKVNASPVQPAADSGGTAAAGATQLQGLDAMVAELLRPMLRRWLDENMPRLVSAALKAEADNLSRRDPQKP
jgi:cell pole-organizing protein PopZ